MRTFCVTGSVARVPDLAAVPDALEAYLSACRLSRRLVVSGDPILAHLDWPQGVVVEQRAARGGDAVAVTGAFAAVAETGTVVRLSGSENPTALNFLPDDHIVVLSRDQVLRHLDDVWVKLRSEGRVFPRTVNLISGPSKTADVEQTIQVGAHGPRRFHVIVVERV